MKDDQRRAERLRDTLVAVADRHQPDADAWTRIHDRAQDGTPGLTAVTPASDGRHRNRTRLLAAAAVLVAIAAIGAAVFAAQDGDATKVATTPPDDEPTGWYIPVGLPDGWSVTSVSSYRSDDACPCRQVVWASADRSRSITANRADAPENDDPPLDVGPDDMTTFEVADGVSATRYGPSERDDSWNVEWTVDGTRQYFNATGIPLSEAEAIAQALYEDPDTDELPVAGLSVLGEWREDGDIGRNVHVDVALLAPSGNPVAYSLEAPRSDVLYAWRYEPTDRLPGQPFETLADESGGSSDQGEMPIMRDYLGRWPGALVRSTGMREGRAGSTEVSPTDAEVEVLMASLRPATTEEWRDFVAQAGNRDRTVTASATLGDLISGVTSPSPAEPTTTTTAANGLVGDVGDLELTLTAAPQLAGWEDADATLTVHNPTTATITDPSCALDQAEIALLPADDATSAAVDAIPAGDPWWSPTGPCDGGMTVEGGASKTLRLVIRAQFPDSRYGPLPGGTYEATVRLAGADRFEAPAPVPVVIGGESCSNGAEDYIGLTEPEARTLAGERLMAEVRVPEPGTESTVANDGERCDRINLVVGDDGLVTYARAY